MALSSTEAERIEEMRRTLAKTKSVLDECVFHPSDAEGPRLLAEQIERNRKLTDLVEKVAGVLSEVDR